DYRIQSRGGKGLTNYHVKKYGDVAAIKVVDLDDDVIIISSDGVIIRIQASSIRECARPSKGVRVMRVDGVETRVVTLARAPHDEGEELDDAQIEDDGSAESAEDLVEDEDDEEQPAGEPSEK
ncbi:MAG TPA: DNA gyrase subunit A, partial [Ruminococcaceae bacterium]|nr:DNA gyrase subunit A [Oscillospiraceae bacterium]